MSTHGTELHPRTDQDAGPKHAPLHRTRALNAPAMRMPLVAALALAVVASMAVVTTARAQGDADEGATETATAAEPGLCLEATSSVLDPGAWSEVLDAVTAATERNTDFFPDAAIVTIPDLTRSWDAGAFPTVKIGIWGTGGSDPSSTDERRERLAVTDCLRDGSEWTTTISHDLVLAAAERILAGARQPQDGAEPLISEDVEADIDVEFHPAEQRVRTILDWSKPVPFLEPGGLCWIDDVLEVDAGEVVVSSQADMDVKPFSESGCALFQEFLDGTGAGSRAVDLLPTEISLADDTVMRFVVASVDVEDSAIVLAGPVDHD